MSPIDKIYRNKTLPSILKGDKIVFTNGCFDILHPGHLDYLMRSSYLGDILVVGLNSDSSTKRLKGPNRPINSFESRSIMLAYFDFIDYVVEFDDDTPLEIIKEIKPSVLVKGGDYEFREIVGGDFVTSYGGTVTTLSFIPGYSSSKIIEKIKRQ